MTTTKATKTATACRFCTRPLVGGGVTDAACDVPGCCRTCAERRDDFARTALPAVVASFVRAGMTTDADDAAVAFAAYDYAEAMMRVRMQER